ncbi:MAG: hypothetical protein V4511_09955 [Bacteroidota bacterium]
MTLKSKLTFFLFCFSSLLFSQQSRLSCNGFKFEQYSGAWPAKIWDCRVRYYHYTLNNWNKLHTKDTATVNKIKQQIFTRAGKEFHDQLELVDLIVSRQTPKCNNIKYTFRYVFKIDSTFRYRFSLDYDKEGNLIGDNAFPSINKNPGFYKLSSVCPSIDSLVNDTSFTNFYNKFKNDLRFAITKVQLDYDKESSSFVYKIYGITMYEGDFRNGGGMGWWNGKLIIINAQTGRKIRTENYKEYKYTVFR